MKNENEVDVDEDGMIDASHLSNEQIAAAKIISFFKGYMESITEDLGEDS